MMRGLPQNTPAQDIPYAYRTGKLIMFILDLTLSRVSAVGIATGYGLDD
jgi:hypothetical protein